MARALARKRIELILQENPRELEEFKSMLAALQCSIGHSSCYCPSCKELSAQYWSHDAEQPLPR